MQRSTLVAATGALLLSATVAAQQPPRYIALGLKSSSPNSSQPGILFVDPLTGTATPVSSLTPGRSLTHVTALSAGPGFMGTLAAGSQARGVVLPLIWQLPLVGNRHASATALVPITMPTGTVPYRVAHTRLAQGVAFTIRGGAANDLYFVDVKTKKLTRANAGISAGTALAGEVVVLGDKAYAAFASLTGTRRGIIVEWRLDGKSKPTQILNVGNPVVGMVALSGTLLLVNDNGALDLLTRAGTAWVPVRLANTGIRGTLDLVSAPYGPQYHGWYFAVANSQGGTDIIGWSLGGAQKKVFTDPRAFGDMDQFVSTEGGVLFYGSGCRGTAGTPRMALSGYPTRGNASFAVAMQGGPTNAASLLAIGSRRANTSLAPMGAPGCFLHNDILVVLGSRTTATGTATITAGVPTNASLRGVHVFGQWGIADRAANAAGLITTEGAEYVIY